MYKYTYKGQDSHINSFEVYSGIMFLNPSENDSNINRKHVKIL